MSKLSLFSLIGMIVVAVVIGVMYIRPTIAEISTIEATTALYKREILKVSGVNATLANKLSQLESVSSSDRQALEVYLPDAVDEVAVMKDITGIFATAGAVVDNITYLVPADDGTQVETEIVDVYEQLQKYDFTVAATLDSAQLLQVLSAMEVNNYLLQVTNLKVTPTETTTVLKSVFEVTAFARAAVIPVVE